jgi:glycyl-tRNA synthetase
VRPHREGRRRPPVDINAWLPSARGGHLHAAAICTRRPSTRGGHLHASAIYTRRPSARGGHLHAAAICTRRPSARDGHLHAAAIYTRRPETAQGIFVNFPRLFEFQKGNLPFACAQIGVSFRNEIAPRNGLVRCREFMMAEIEHFADPTQLNNFPKFEAVKDLKLPLLSAGRQQANEEATVLSLEDAVSQGIICHKTLGYFIGRTFLFLKTIGIDTQRIRFRQHRSNEKAHYALDCWDAEVLLSCGWLECVGLADRQSFDLTQHTNATDSAAMRVHMPCEPYEEERDIKIILQKGIIGKTFKGDAPAICQFLESIPASRAQEIAEKLKCAEGLSGEEFDALTSIDVDGRKVTGEMYSVNSTRVTVTRRSFIPCVIEPSFGIGRIMVAVLEHSFYLREDGERRVLRLQPQMAPYKCVVLPLRSKISEELVQRVQDSLRDAGIVHQIDCGSASIGKRYARSDELGVPFAITIDQETEAKGTVTLRHRDSCAQVRLAIRDAAQCVKAMSSGAETWEQVAARFPAERP